MESASWQRPLYGFKITQNQAEMPLKSGFSDGLGGGKKIADTFQNQVKGKSFIKTDPTA